MKALFVVAAILVSTASALFIGDHAYRWTKAREAGIAAERSRIAEAEALIQKTLTEACRSKYGAPYYASKEKGACCGQAASGEFCQPKAW